MSPERSAASAPGANPKQMAATHPQRNNIFGPLSQIKAPNAVIPKRTSIALPHMSALKRKPKDRKSCVVVAAHVSMPLTG